MKIKNNVIAVLAGLAVAGVAGSASATTWVFNNTNSNTSDGINATASAWGSTANGPAGTNTALESAFLTYNGSSGLGVKNNDCGSPPCTGSGDTNEGVSPEHAIDNAAIPTRGSAPSTRSITISVAMPCCSRSATR